MRWIVVFLTAGAAFAQGDKIAEGRNQFGQSCSYCHGADGRGGERGPDISARGLDKRTDLPSVIRNGLPNRGMPGTKATDAQVEALVAFLRSIARAPAPVRETVAGRGPTVAELDAPPEGAWPQYNGQPGGNRYSTLRAINTANVERLRMEWIFPFPGSARLEVTPVVFDGVMYITGPNEVFALEAATGRQLWHFRRGRTAGVPGDAGSGINRGVAILNDSVFLATDNAHLLALDSKTGSIRWEVEMADWKQNYGATAAPLVAGDVVISGVSGGDEGIRGFVAAYKVSGGQEAWRFWTIPKPGEPLAETWRGKALEHGCAATWMTGTYDPGLGLVYWPTGNPCPDFNGEERQGDNLYADSVVALDRATGKLRWYYQFTPHDLYDWDAQETPVLIDTAWKGAPRKLLVQADRNGFFYVLDRTDGKLLLAEPFVKRLNWATGIDLSSGKPKLVSGVEPSAEGTVVCPPLDGATNWMSPAYNPETGFYYVVAQEGCNVTRKSAAVWEAGKSYYGGGSQRAPGVRNQQYIRAIELATGKIAWDVPLEGPGHTWGGILATAGGLLFFGDQVGDFVAADARTGAVRWKFHANQAWHSSPMAYTAGGRQFVATAAGTSVVVFGLP
jgi:alcohol dehydrogenase (cytochrome c)